MSRALLYGWKLQIACTTCGRLRLSVGGVGVVQFVTSLVEEPEARILEDRVFRVLKGLGTQAPHSTLLTSVKTISKMTAAMFQANVPIWPYVKTKVLGTSEHLGSPTFGGFNEPHYNLLAIEPSNSSRFLASRFNCLWCSNPLASGNLRNAAVTALPVHKTGKLTKNWKL